MAFPELPAELCRFRSFASPSGNGQDKEGVYSLLLGRLRFSDITTFNDPFEARPHYVPAFADPNKQHEAMCRYLSKIAPITGDDARRRRWAEDAMEGKSMEELVELASGRNAERAGRLFVFCAMAPETVNSPLPWAHYADSHRGVCIHLDSEVRPLPLAFPVVYSGEYPRLVVPRTERDPTDAMQMILLRKCDQWSYEKEYRVIRSKLPGAGLAGSLGVKWDGEIALASSSIVRAITLGCRMEAVTRSNLIQWTSEHAPHVEVWQADLHRSRYEVVRERIA